MCLVPEDDGTVYLVDRHQPGGQRPLHPATLRVCAKQHAASGRRVPLPPIDRDEGHRPGHEDQAHRPAQPDLGGTI